MQIFLAKSKKAIRIVALLTIVTITLLFWVSYEKRSQRQRIANLPAVLLDKFGKQLVIPTDSNRSKGVAFATIIPDEVDLFQLATLIAVIIF